MHECLFSKGTPNGTYGIPLSEIPGPLLDKVSIFGMYGG